MEEQIEQILELLLNSVTIDELPVASGISDANKMIFFNPTTQRVESITKALLVGVKVWHEIEGAEVKKAGGNVDFAVQESGDTVRDKLITNGGLPVLIPYGVYDASLDSADKQSAKSYVVPTILS